ncbi:4-hydroxy-tetrahydrodipicolinate reductase [Frankliniella fusca]|nr:4-hydroxy-tetrahydrodipicolinate reductase [Frankliniella fusca]KAK3915681.1 4-hydroxy-tetrahydrodipicolinate reductase [Frankliniella fusca]KAK3932354.1 4-hydroxy-tetrahydrodipicolinate reductase [Frankliniella fusca]
MAVFEEFNKKGEIIPYIKAKEISVGDVFVPIVIGKCMTKFGERLYADVNIEEVKKRLVLPKRYSDFPEGNVLMLNREIERNCPPKIKAVARCGEGFRWEMKQHGEEFDATAAKDI